MMSPHLACSARICAAHEKSSSGAARRLEVSVTAVAKLVAALEKTVGVLLFERSSHGLILTAAGGSYLDACLRWNNSPRLTNRRAPASHVRRAPWSSACSMSSPTGA